jgi:hypothetical protein
MYPLPPGAPIKSNSGMMIIARSNGVRFFMCILPFFKYDRISMAIIFKRHAGQTGCHRGVHWRHYPDASSTGFNGDHDPVFLNDVVYSPSLPEGECAETGWA